MKSTVAFLFVISSLCFSQDFWEQTNGPYGGDIRFLSNIPNGYIFASSGGRNFRSTDNGNYWIELNNNGLPYGYGISSLIFNSNNQI
ncbi:MAG TPA: hypothetical protein VIH28_00905, partial [Ignavibacteriaceae bacterium]